MLTETQTCTKCQIEKSVTEFHRRRNTYHKICKDCRNQIEAARYATQGKQPLPRQTQPIRRENFETLQARIQELDARLHAKAAAFAHDNLDADDIYAVMVEAILTKSLPTEADAYILQRANWAAQAYIAKTLTYSQYVDDLDLDDSAVNQGGFRVVTHPRGIEDQLVAEEQYAEIQAVLASLPEENRKIVALLSIGYKQKDIAVELHVNEQTISEKIKSLRLSLKAQLA